MNLNIIITGAGAPGIRGTYYCIKKQKKFESTLIGTDIDSEVVGRYFLDKFYAVPSPSGEFVEKIHEIARKEKVNVILPQVTKELAWFAKYKDDFIKDGIHVLVSDERSVELSNNKYKILVTCRDKGIDCAGNFFLVNNIEDLKNRVKELGYPNVPVIVKRPVSNGMRGLRILDHSFDPLDNFLNNKPDNARTTLEDFLSIFPDKNIPEMVVSEYYPGKEYSVDILANKGEMVVCVPRVRDRIRSGITFAGQVVQHKEIIDFSRKIVEVLSLDSAVGLQFKEDAEGNVKLLESNPRIQGTMVMSALANANIITGSVMQAVTGDSGLSQDDINWSARYLRYWGGLGIIDEQIVEI